MYSPAASLNVSPANADRLIAPGDQPHLDALMLGIVNGHVLEGRAVEVAAELPVQVTQQVQVEFGRDARGIVVGGLQDLRALDHVDANQQAAFVIRLRAHLAEQFGRLVLREIADGGAGEVDDITQCFAPRLAADPAAG
jgi:hypothetical protein